MDETSACYTEAFKKEFTEEQRKTLILSIIDYVPTDCLSLVANVHEFGAFSLREGVKGYLKELMERESTTTEGRIIEPHNAVQKSKRHSLELMGFDLTEEHGIALGYLTDDEER